MDGGPFRFGAGAEPADTGGERDCRPLHPHPDRDLLGQEPQEKLEIRLCPDGSGQLYVPGLTEFRVQSVDDINKVWSWGDGAGNVGSPRPELSEPVSSSVPCRG